MNSLYFSVQNSGYQCRAQYGKLNVDHTKQIPVYKVVNEFMNYEPKQNNFPIRQVEEQTYHFDEQTGSRLPRYSNTNKRIKYVLFDSNQASEKSQIQSLDISDQSFQQQAREKETSVKQTEASRMNTNNDQNLNLSFSDYKHNRDHQSGSLTDRSILELELEKQKILRKNLEKSYKNLLENLRKDQRLIYNQNLSSGDRKLTRAQTARRKRFHQPQSEEEETDDRYTNQPSKTRHHQSSCCNLKVKQFKQEDEEDNLHIFANQEEQQLEKKYKQHLQNERGFSLTLAEGLEGLKSRIQGLEQNIVKQEAHLNEQQLKMQLIAKQKSILELQVENSQLKGNKASGQLFGEKLCCAKHHVHYLFTILIMFLIIAMITGKN